MSSDANGSLPKFDDHGRFIGMGVGQIDVLRQAIRRLVLEEGVAEESNLPCVTANPVTRLRLNHRKGRILKGMDADLVLFDSDWRLTQVYCRGRMLVEQGRCLVEGPLGA